MDELASVFNDQISCIVIAYRPGDGEFAALSDGHLIIVAYLKSAN